ncbi:MAG: VTT domain-containing protein [Euryarchaeota archaeon]|nr:VTT domain-containing protein [Euryarchaeota archaeon]
MKETIQHNDEVQQSKKKTIRDIWKPPFLLGLIIVVLIFSVMYNVQLKEFFLTIRNWIQSLGFWAPLGYIGIYIILTVVALPGLLLGIIAGSVFGSVVGIILVSISSTLSAGIAFIIARHFARDSAERWLSSHTRLQQLDDLTEKHGALIVALARLNFLLPFNLLNYAFGLTKVSFKTYLFWSWLCMLPAIILVVVFGDLFTESVLVGKISWMSIGVVITAVCLLGIVVFAAQKKFRNLNH